jgi:hypothetical protein
MKQSIIISVLLLVILAAIGVILVFDIGRNGAAVEVKSFADCVEAGYPVMESHPRQCKTPATTFTEVIATTTPTTTPAVVTPVTHATSTATSTISNLIKVTEPTSKAVVQSPLKITGSARGQWYFEASFPLELVDANGKVIAEAPAQAKGSWMTTNFVPFEASLTFTKPTTKTGILRLMNSNASGDPERDLKLEIPVTFSQ